MKINMGHKVSTKIKESPEVAYFGASFALTEVHGNLRDRNSEVWLDEIKAISAQLSWSWGLG